MGLSFETFSVMAVGTAFLSVTAATTAFMASPKNWWMSLLLSLAAMVLLTGVALKARNRAFTA